MNYHQLFWSVMVQGRSLPSRYGETKELTGGQFECMAMERPVRGSQNSAIGWMELTQLLAGVYDFDAIAAVAPKAQLELFTPEMAYGPRAVDQIPAIINALRSNPETRQAVVFIGSHTDGPTSKQPCTSTIQFLLREDQLNAIVSMRSWDLIKGLPYDMMMFGGLTQAVAWCLQVQPGHVQVNAGSCHIYRADLVRDIDPKPECVPFPMRFSGREWHHIQKEASENIDHRKWVDEVPSYVQRKPVQLTLPGMRLN